jgi:hypothetical protein
MAPSDLEAASLAKRNNSETSAKSLARHRKAMSSKAKNKIKNNESKLTEVIADAVITASPAEATLPDNGVTQTHVEAASASPIVNVPTSEAPSQLPLALRMRIATGKAVVSVFASVRAAEAKAVQKARTWITVADASISKSLLVSEQFLLIRLRVTLD